VPTALKLQEEYGESLAVVFVESQNSGADKVASFALDRGWLGGGALWTSEAPFRTAGNGLPKFALLSASGEVILSGSSSALHSAMKDAIAAEVKALRKGPASAPRALRKAWAERSKGNYSKAVGIASDLIEKPSTADDLRSAAAAFVETTASQVQSRLDRARWMLDNGYLMEAEAMLAQLSKGIGGLEEEEAAAQELRAEIAAPDNAAELKAEKALSKLEAKLYEKGADSKMVKSLNKFIAKHEGTKAAERAQALARMAAGTLG